MKVKDIFGHKLLCGIVSVILGMTVVSCEDEPDKFKLTGGTPEVMYIRPVNVEQADSLLTGAFLDNQICIVGKNLTSIHELYFNDQKAILNTSLITANTLLVTIPKAIPEVVTNKIYMINKAGVTTEYDFNVYVPAPSVRSISCEYAPVGSVATIYGDYFIDDPNVPLKITFAGNVEVPRDNIKAITKSSIQFVIPSEWVEGYMNVTTIYGTSRSAYRFHDTTNILFDWDGSHGGHATGYGWRNGVIHAPGEDEGIEAIDGNYLYFGGVEMKGGVGETWAEDQFSFNYWPDESGENGPLNLRPEFAALISKYGIEKLQMKFECCVPSAYPWSASGLQIIFSPMSVVSSSNSSNGYLSDTSIARGIWNPWRATGSYDTGNSWVTVSVPMNTFTYTHEGGACSAPLTAESLAGLAFFVWNGGIEGTTCNPVILIDNIRVVPVE